MNTPHASDRDASEPGRFQDITFTADADQSEQKYLRLLPDAFNQADAHDLILGLHGHGADRHQFAAETRAECAAFRDFARQHRMIAITPDYRATTSWMGPLAEADMLQIMASLRREFNLRRVFLAGASMGGTSALTFAALHPEATAGVTAMNPHANHLEYTNFQDAIAASFGGAKRQIPLEYKRRSAEYWPETLAMPVALTTGGRDQDVPPASALRLAGVLRQLGHPCLLIHRPEGGHSTTYEDAMAALAFMLNPVFTPVTP